MFGITTKGKANKVERSLYLHLEWSVHFWAHENNREEMEKIQEE